MRSMAAVMPMSKVTKHLSLFFGTLLLGFVISGKDGPIAIYLGYFSFGYLAPMLLLRSGREYTALVLWTFLLVVFAFVFESDRMMWPDYRPTRDGIAVLCAVPILAMVLGCGFLLIDRLMRVERPLKKADAGKAYNPHGSPVMPVPMAKTDRAYPPLLGLWFLWPLGALLVAVLDGNRAASRPFRRRQRLGYRQRRRHRYRCRCRCRCRRFRQRPGPAGPGPAGRRVAAVGARSAATRETSA